MHNQFHLLPSSSEQMKRKERTIITIELCLRIPRTDILPSLWCSIHLVVHFVIWLINSTLLFCFISFRFASVLSLLSKPIKNPSIHLFPRTSQNINKLHPYCVHIRLKFTLKMYISLFRDPSIHLFIAQRK